MSNDWWRMPDAQWLNGGFYWPTQKWRFLLTNTEMEVSTDQHRDGIALLPLGFHLGCFFINTVYAPKSIGSWVLLYRVNVFINTRGQVYSLYNSHIACINESYLSLDVQIILNLPQQSWEYQNCGVQSTVQYSTIQYSTTWHLQQSELLNTTTVFRAV